MDHIRLDPIMFQAKPVPGPPESGNHFIGDQQDIIRITDFSNSPKVLIGRHYDTTRALDGLRDKRRNIVGTLAQNRCFQEIGRRHTRAGRRIGVDDRLG